MSNEDNDGYYVPSVLRDAGEGYDGEVYIVGIRESTDPDAWSLQIQECLDAADPQEIELGDDTYCLVVDPGQATFYGGVRECEITAGLFRLVLTEEAAEALGMPKHTTFELELPEDQHRVLRRGLAKVLTCGRVGERPRRLILE